MSNRAGVHHVMPEDVMVTLRGPVPEAMVDRAKEQVATATRFSDRDVQAAKVVLTERTNPAVGEPSRAEVSIDITGAQLRAEMKAPTPEQALDGAVRRLERRIADHVNRRHERSRWLQDVPWRRGDRPAERPSHFPRPDEERDVVRRKTFAVAHSTVEEAAYDMESLDHDFHLFTDAVTGSPAVIHHRTDGTYGAAGLDADTSIPETVTLEPSPPTIDEATARQRLDDGQEPFVFYIDASTAEGAVIYRRYDGHYGVISTT
jgi:ribosome-associated translation inhibitor RaiA